jgi:hypothetical protein
VHTSVVYLIEENVHSHDSGYWKAPDLRVCFVIFHNTVNTHVFGNIVNPDCSLGLSAGTTARN